MGSRRGLPENPAWVHSLRAAPYVELRDGPEKHDHLAREPAGTERDLWWDRAVTACPDHADHQATTTRTIPVLLLTRT